MKKHLGLSLFLLMTIFSASRAAADTRLIVRDKLGLSHLKLTCLLLGCNVVGGLGDDQGQVFLITVPLNLNLGSFLNSLKVNLGIVSVELDQTAKLRQSASSGIPAALYDNRPVNYYGTTVREGYLLQAAAGLTRIADAQNAFNVRGSGIVAVIDTGVDPTHPVLQNVLVPGYDFTRNKNGADEKGDVSQSTAAVLDSNTQPILVNQSTAAVLDQSTAAVLDGSEYVGFGHGTMVAGVIHLVAPGAHIMPLKAFNADGTGYTSDVIRAIYYAAHNNAKVINMSFSFPNYSNEIYNSVNYAVSRGAISIAAAGNDGKQTVVYPAGYTNLVMGVASTDNNDNRSTFSNYGSSLVWVAAPGEGIVTTYPYGSWAAAWGTSFSTPFVAGAAALLLDLKASCTETQASSATAHAKALAASLGLGNGRLDVYQAVQAWMQSK